MMSDDGDKLNQSATDVAFEVLLDEDELGKFKKDMELEEAKSR